MTVAVLGAGMVGRAIALDLTKEHKVSAFDLNKNNLLLLKDRNAEIETAAADLSNYSLYKELLGPFDLVVTAVPGFMGFHTLEAVINARAKATSVTVDPSKLTPESIQQFQQAQDELSSAFNRLMVVVERYPQLQTTQQFRDFQVQIEGTENRINKARDDFNLSVQDYNTYIKKFPTNMMAGMFGFTEKGYFKSNPGSENPPDINFNMDSKPAAADTAKR